ncbi:CMRF35-like molecule 6 [Perognathus longimembris pacificus]|uniref:CMRF35-like molecule 6 n=1 Tax=Perognathus longimembris pacificus TaxID=214514 RepID=UPI0020185D06|nr:CMRF35-like molecule 6 [Perognathus longimembris pacificus]
MTSAGRQCINMKTEGEKGEVSRVFTHDHPENLTFTMIWKSLLLEDTGSYWCEIEEPLAKGSHDNFKFEVSVLPAYSSKNNKISLEPPTLGPPPMYTWPSTTRKVTPGPSPQPGSLMCSVHFVVLVFLELPLLLSMLSAVLWVNRPLRRPRQEVD